MFAWGKVAEMWLDTSAISRQAKGRDGAGGVSGTVCGLKAAGLRGSLLDGREETGRAA